MSKTKDEKSGIVYVLTNPAMPGLVKIGQTKRDKIEARLKELYGTGVPLPFECRYACRVAASECAKIEKALHMAFAPNRINKNREFFEVKVEQVVAILELFHRDDITHELAEEMNQELTADDQAASAQFKSRRPRLNYLELGLHVGDTLMFIPDPTVRATIVDERKVAYQGEEYSLTALTVKLLNLPYSIQPTSYWEFNGQNLQDIYNAHYTWVE